MAKELTICKCFEKQSEQLRVDEGNAHGHLPASGTLTVERGEQLIRGRTRINDQNSAFKRKVLNGYREVHMVPVNRSPR